MICLLGEYFLKAMEAVWATAGHPIIDVRDTDLQGIEDTPLFEIVQRRNAILCSK